MHLSPHRDLHLFSPIAAPQRLSSLAISPSPLFSGHPRSFLSLQMKTMAMRNNILPDDILLFYILPRLPPRCIGRFMCVCKQWHSFLTTPLFTKMHLHHVNNQNDHKHLVISTAKPCNYFGTIDCEAPEVGLSAKRSLPFEVGSKGMLIISSLNGLVCVGISWFPSAYNYNYLDIILWNPLTGDYKTLSKGNYFKIPTRGCGLYYSCCDDDYKLLRVTETSDAYIYSWKSDSWRKAKSRVDSLPKFWGYSCLVNEQLYFLAQGTKGSIIERFSLIIRFDTKTEMFTEIATPSLICYDMMVIRGCIHLFVISITDDDGVELWKMDGDGEWTKVVCYCGSMCTYQPVHLMKNGNWLLHLSNYLSQGGYVYEIDLTMSTKAKEVRRYPIGDGTMSIIPRGKFIETIVSLKHLFC